MTIRAEQGSTQDYCSRFPEEGHHWISHTRGGEPLWIRICSFCTYIDWDGLREQVLSIQKNTLAEIDPMKLAKTFHAMYEILAPDFDYRTREASAKPWADVPEQNKALMIATCGAVIQQLVSFGTK